jgi:hypothetical protein
MHMSTHLGEYCKLATQMESVSRTILDTMPLDISITKFGSTLPSYSEFKMAHRSVTNIIANTAYSRSKRVQYAYILLNLPIVCFIVYMWIVHHELANANYATTNAKYGTTVAILEFILSVGVQPYIWAMAAYSCLPYMCAVLHLCYIFDTFYSKYDKHLTKQPSKQTLNTFIQAHQHLMLISDQINEMFASYCLIVISIFTPFATFLTYTIIADILEAQLFISLGHLPTFLCMLLTSIITLAVITLPASMLNERVGIRIVIQFNI